MWGFWGEIFADLRVNPCFRAKKGDRGVGLG